jgi:hypothetical protein
MTSAFRLSIIVLACIASVSPALCSQSPMAFRRSVSPVAVADVITSDQRIVFARYALRQFINTSNLDMPYGEYQMYKVSTRNAVDVFRAAVKSMNCGRPWKHRVVPVKLRKVAAGEWHVYETSRCGLMTIVHGDGTVAYEEIALKGRAPVFVRILH